MLRFLWPAEASQAIRHDKEARIGHEFSARRAIMDHGQRHAEGGSKGTLRVHVPKQYVLWPQSTYIGTLYGQSIYCLGAWTLRGMDSTLTAVTPEAQCPGIIELILATLGLQGLIG